MHSLSVIVLLFLLSPTCESHNILLLPFNMGSRFTYFGELGKALVAHGNNVTMVFGEKMRVPADLIASGINFEFYRMREELVTSHPALPRMIMDASMSRNFLGTLKSMKKFMSESESEAEQMFHDPRFMRRITGGKFDFAVVDLLYPMSVLAYKLDIPYAVLSIDYFWWTYRMPINPSYVPSAIAWYGDEMTFMERSVNTLLYVITMPIFFGELHQDKIAKYAPERPTVNFNDLQGRPSLVFKLQNLAMDYPRPSPPNVINVGGLMARPASPLPTDLEEFVSEAQHGVIVVSFGSWFQDLPGEVAGKFAEAFSRLPQRVVWKFSPSSASQVETLSPNVKVMSWLPQNDLLGHERTRLFITHCGIGGATEALYHAVPVLAVPLALDQLSNANRALRKGTGEVLDISDFTVDEMLGKIDRIVNGTYRENARRASEVLRDLPSGADTAVFWIEHVIKFGDNHLKLKAFKLPWYQYLILDVLLVWGVVLAAGSWILYRLLRFVVGLFLRLCSFISTKCFYTVQNPKYLRL